MSAIRNTWYLFTKELRDTFTSPLVYILTALFCLMIGWLFFNYLILSKDLYVATLTQSVLKPVFGNMNFMFLFLAPLITMKSFAEEKSSGTLNLLYTSKLSMWQIIVGKFLANVSTVLFMLLFTLVFPIVLYVSGYSDWGIIVSSYIGIFFSIACFVAVGMFASSLTENQVIAAVLSFSILLGLLLMALAANSSNNYIIGHFFQYLSVAFHHNIFVSGAVRSYSFIYFFSFIGFFFFLTNKSLDSRNW